MSEKQHIGLLDLQEAIRETLEEGFCDSVWVKAEISELKQNYSGHCYLTLVEKDESSKKVLAKASAIIWSSSWRTLKPYFEAETGSPLSVGMNVLVMVQVQYSGLYGLSLIIYDIDPSFTVGGLELERQKTIARLKEEGMFDMNCQLGLPALPRRFALVTSATAAGYRDFLHHIDEEGSPYGLQFELFSAIMQGQDCPSSIVSALEAIAARAEDFDAVLIMRGGGGAMDLACFDDYDLAVNVAQFPLPVLTGIGHDHDYHVVDMVAHTNVKTPTALADFLIDIYAQEEFRLSSLVQRLHTSVKSKSAVQLAVFDKMVLRMRSAVGAKSAQMEKSVELLEMRIAAVDPEKALDRGYLIALRNGRRIGSASEFAAGDRLTLMFKDGVVEAQVKEIKKK